ncbi:MAG: hypothetical protein RJA63_2392 [Pseudomonadota bacterium]|jgi:endoglucanase
MRKERQALFNTRLRFGSWLVLCALAGGWATSAGAQQATNLVSDPAFSLRHWRLSSASLKPVPGSSVNNYACIPLTSERKAEDGRDEKKDFSNLIYLPGLAKLEPDTKYRFSFQAYRETRSGASLRRGPLMASVTATEYGTGATYQGMIYAESQVAIRDDGGQSAFTFDFVTPVLGKKANEPSSRATEIMFQALSDSDGPAGTNVCVTNVVLTKLGANKEIVDVKNMPTRILYNQVVVMPETSDTVANITVVKPPIPSTLEAVSSTGRVLRRVPITQKTSDVHSNLEVASVPISGVSGAAFLRVVDASGAVVTKTDELVKFVSSSGYNSFAPNLRRDALHFFYAQRAGQRIIDRRYQRTGYRTWLDREAGPIVKDPVSGAWTTAEKATCFDGSDYGSAENKGYGYKDNYGNSHFNACYVGQGNRVWRDVSGGWFDAGDYGKYVVNAAASLWALHNVIEQRSKDGRLEYDYPDGMLGYGTNGRSDLLDEARHEMEWLLKMQIRADEGIVVRVPVGDWDTSRVDGYGTVEQPQEMLEISGRKYKPARYHVKFRTSELPASKAVGLVFSAVRDNEWTDLPIKPEHSNKIRVLDYPTTAATLNFAAIAAQAARIWRDRDPEFSARCLAAAELAYAAAVKNPSIYRYGEFSDSKVAVLPAINQGGGAYAESKGKGDLGDAWLWANVELYLSKSQAGVPDSSAAQGHLKAIASRPAGGAVEGASPFSFTIMDWAQGFSWKYNKNIALMSLLVNGRDGEIKEKYTAATQKTVGELPSASLITVADSLIDSMNASAFGVPNPAVFNWASNADIANAGVLVSYAARYGGGVAYTRQARRIMSYLLGHNPLGKSYVTGYGSNPARNPHHRFWAKHLDISFPSAPPGMLVGGPNGKWDGSVLGATPGTWASGKDSGNKIYLSEIVPTCNRVEEVSAVFVAATNAGGIACYQDHIDLYMTNEVAINWNAALFRLADAVR